MAPRRIASGSVIVLLVAVVLLAVGSWLVIANRENRAVSIMIAAITAICLLGMINGARQAARHDRETRRP